MIGQGTWYNDNEDAAATIDALRRGLDLGMTHIDTAEMYLSGSAEDLVAEAIAGRRDEVFLVSKVLPQNASRNGTIAACERSLTPSRPTGWTATSCTGGVTTRCRRPSGLRAASERREDPVLGREQFRCPRPGGSPADRRARAHRLQPGPLPSPGSAIEHAVLTWCEEHGVAVVAYSPFGHGDFPGPHTEGGRMLQATAAAHHATARVALIPWPACLFAIPKASRAEHAVENAGAGDRPAHRSRACPDR